MTDKLSLYNGALLEVGHRRLATLTEEAEGRRVLDDYYDKVVDYCLEAGQWNFAIRSVQIDSDPDIETEFGFAHVFGKPDDWIRTTGISANDRFDPPLVDSEYKDETEYWLANCDPIFLRYVSSHEDFGRNLSRWPETFSRYVELELASRAVRRIANDKGDKERIERDRDKARSEAMNKDAMNEGTRFPPEGAWVRSRRGYSGRDRNPRSRPG